MLVGLISCTCVSSDANGAHILLATKSHPGQTVHPETNEVFLLTGVD